MHLRARSTTGEREITDAVRILRESFGAIWVGGRARGQASGRRDLSFKVGHGGGESGENYMARPETWGLPSSADTDSVRSPRV